MPFKNAIQITQKSPRGPFSSVVCEITTIIISRNLRSSVFAVPPTQWESRVRDFSAQIQGGSLPGGGGENTATNGAPQFAKARHSQKSRKRSVWRIVRTLC